MSNWIIFESLFVFAVWMQRKGRWAIFGQAMSGKYTVGGSVRAGSQAYQYSDNTGKVAPAGQGSGSSGASGAPSIGGAPPGARAPITFGPGGNSGL